MLLRHKVKVIVNGNWIGITESPEELFKFMKKKKKQGIINVYASIIFDVYRLEIKICNEAGRITRPVVCVENGKSLLTKEVINKIKKMKLDGMIYLLTIILIEQHLNILILMNKIIQ